MQSISSSSTLIMKSGKPLHILQEDAPQHIISNHYHISITIIRSISSKKGTRSCGGEKDATNIKEKRKKKHFYDVCSSHVSWVAAHFFACIYHKSSPYTPNRKECVGERRSKERERTHKSCSSGYGRTDVYGGCNMLLSMSRYVGNICRQSEFTSPKKRATGNKFIWLYWKMRPLITQATISFPFSGSFRQFYIKMQMHVVCRVRVSAQASKLVFIAEKERMNMTVGWMRRPSKFYRDLMEKMLTLGDRASYFLISWNF